MTEAALPSPGDRTDAPHVEVTSAGPIRDDRWSDLCDAHVPWFLPEAQRHRSDYARDVTDSRLRDLERHWRVTGAVEDEAAWLRERLRVGELKEAQVELAAYLGHGAATALVAVKSSTIRGLVTGLSRWESDVIMRRVAVALLRQTDWRQVPRARHALRLLEADVECRCSAHWGELAALPNPPYPDDGRGRATARAARYAVIAALYPEGALEAMREVVQSLLALDQNDAMQGLRADLVPWILGYSDPVRQRVTRDDGSAPDVAGES